MSDELHVTVHTEDGSLWATVAEFPGVFATGDTLEELRESLREGIELYLSEPGKKQAHVELGGLTLIKAPATASAVVAYA